MKKEVIKGRPKLNLVLEYLKDVKGKSYTDEEAIDLVKNCGKILDQKFKDIKDKNGNTIKNFYKSCDEYLFDLASVNDWSVFENRIRVAKNSVLKNNLKTIVDYGGGAGYACLEFAKAGLDVTYVDFKDGVIWNFAKWLFKREGVKVKMIDVNKFFESDKKYDVLYSSDVLEHVFHLGRTLIKFTEVTKEAIIVFYCFSDNGYLSQHIHIVPEANFYMFTLFRLHGFNPHLILKDNVFVKQPYYGYEPVLESLK